MNNNKDAANVKFITKFPIFKVFNLEVEKYNQPFYDSNYIINAKATEVYYPPHWTPLSIKCVVKGQEFYADHKSKYAVDENVFLLFNRDKIYTSWIDSQEETESLSINFSPSFEKEVRYSLQSHVIAQLDEPFNCSSEKYLFTEKLYPHDHLITPFIKIIRECMQDEHPDYIKFYELFVQVYERLLLLQQKTNRQIESINKFKGSTRVELFNRLSRAKDYIYSCYQQNLTITEIADIACLNHYYFQHQFRKVFGITPHQFVSRRRIEVAQALLRNTNYSVSEICSRVGFSDLASFSKLFKKHYKHSPQHYRSLMRQALI